MARTKKAPDVPIDRLDEMLARLKLSGIRDQLDSLRDEAARSNLSARETLAMLCSPEIARKDHRRIDMALKLAHFPAAKELSGFRLRGPALDRGDPQRLLGAVHDRHGRWSPALPRRTPRNVSTRNFWRCRIFPLRCARYGRLLC